jgi:hypothetical protein
MVGCGYFNRKDLASFVRTRRGVQFSAAPAWCGCYHAPLMLSFMYVAVGADRLVLSYPLWIGVALLLVAIALFSYAAFARKRIRRRWPISLATLLAAWAGLYFATFNTTITAESGSTYAFMRYDHSVRWKDASDIYLERRGGGSDWNIVVVDGKRRTFEFNVSDLSIDDRDRVMAYIVDRMPENAFRAPALLKREAPVGIRTIGVFSDQQI